ncbi:MAG TPA: TIR domain-containing protein [Steroidobacteraceae bacterium]|nr:TIR domain-containing protein [Steroidobacteraceae bacterium]
MASVFLSYASQDREAALRIGEALRSFGLVVWLDQSELRGGDAWDQKIRRQIRDCDYFMPIISARTESRHEGYFRREWRLAVERTLDMADDHPFLLPVAIDDVSEAQARVPEKFLSVQWLRLPGGQPTPALEAVCRRIASGTVVDPEPPAPTRERLKGSSARVLSPYPPFPLAVPGQALHHWAQVLGWLLRSAWIFFQRRPRWLRIIVYLWGSIALLSMCHDYGDRSPHSTSMKELQDLAEQAKRLREAPDVPRPPKTD